MRQTITKCSKLKPGEENTHESCTKTQQSSHKNSMWSMPSWMNSSWKKCLYCGLLLACERPTGHEYINPIPHLKGYGFSFILWGGCVRRLRAFCGLKSSFWLKSVLATRDVCKRPWCLQHWNQHSNSDPVIPLIAVYNAYGFVTEQINTLTDFTHVSDRVIGTG